MQISVIVAITQYSILRIKAGNGFVTTGFDHELVGPKLLLASAPPWDVAVLLRGTALVVAKGKRVNIPSPVPEHV